MGTVDDCFDKLKTQVGPFLLHAQGFVQDFLLGGEIYWCINEARKCERRGLGESPSLPPPPPPPPQKFVEDLVRGVFKGGRRGVSPPPPPCAILAPPSLILHGQYLFKIPVRAMSETLIYEQLITAEKRL